MDVTPWDDFRADFLHNKGGAHNENGAYEKISSRSYLFIDAWIDICTLPVVEKSSLEIRPRVCGEMRIDGLVLTRQDLFRLNVLVLVRGFLGGFLLGGVLR